MLTINIIIGMNGIEMLVVGQVYDMEEKDQIQFVAEVFIISERFRYLARKQRRKERMIKKKN